ncbi:hypothetical protein ClosIBUN125C_CONTIG19g01315 [Clostridium sp. IBUN125C]|nr:hypothetical protein ClosIBUN125C_CONTIG19g01315 [Clostridium sp. IBUN125C]
MQIIIKQINKKNTMSIIQLTKL